MLVCSTLLSINNESLVSKEGFESKTVLLKLFQMIEKYIKQVKESSLDEDVKERLIINMVYLTEAQIRHRLSLE